MRTTARTKLNGRVALLATLGAIAALALGATSAHAEGGWSVVPSPNASGAETNTLNGVTCASGANCWAVGQYIATGHRHTLAEHYSLGTWRVVASANPSTNGNQLNGVACALGCWAVGQSSADGAGQALIERLKAGKWQPAASPSLNGSEESQLRGVTCVSQSDCWAVGSAGSQNLIEHYNGSEWSVAKSPNPVELRSPVSPLEGVACSSESSCWAVGAVGSICQSNMNECLNTLILHYDGTSWSVVVSQNGSQPFNVLQSVSCATASYCVAAGVTFDLTGNGGTHTLIEEYEGVGWGVVSSPSQGIAALRGVSCKKSGFCAAAGFTGESTLIEQNTGFGRPWATAESANAGTNERNELNAVSCVSSTCFAVGEFGRNTLIEKRS